MVSTRKILIVSSETALQTRFKNCLSEREYDIYYTSMTDDRLRTIIDRTAPDIIVVDRIISSLHCVELSLRIRRWTPTPILVLTTANTLDNEVRSMDFQADDYFSEPFNISIAVERINQILSVEKI
jgi:two-component system, OmpR family, KDP operon response regulator KdpE